MKPQKGVPRTRGGSRKGIPNVVTRDIREMIRASLDEAGGVAYLLRQAEANPASYMALVAKIIPQQIDATIRRELTEMTDAELFTMLESVRALPQRARVIEHEGGVSIRPPVSIPAPKKRKA